MRLRLKRCPGRNCYGTSAANEGRHGPTAARDTGTWEHLPYVCADYRAPYQSDCWRLTCNSWLPNSVREYRSRREISGKCGIRECTILDVRRRRRGTGVRPLSCRRISDPAGRRTDNRVSPDCNRHVSLAIRFCVGKPRYRISFVLGDCGFSFPNTGRGTMVCRCADRMRGVTR